MDKARCGGFRDGHRLTIIVLGRRAGNRPAFKSLEDFPVSSGSLSKFPGG